MSTHVIDWESMDDKSYFSDGRSLCALCREAIEEDDVPIRLFGPSKAAALHTRCFEDLLNAGVLSFDRGTVLFNPEQGPWAEVLVKDKNPFALPGSEKQKRP